MILEAKQFIYRCKLNKCLPTLSAFLQQLMVRYKIEKYNSKISGELSTFSSNWFCYKNYFHSRKLTISWYGYVPLTII